MGINELHDFINRAERNRKYLPNTATSYRTPLRVIESELSDEEKASIDLIKEHLDQIFQFVYSKNPDKWSASSIEEYKKRLRRVIKDFEEYGMDSSKMASWTRSIVVHKPKAERLKINNKKTDDLESEPLDRERPSLNRHEEILSKGKAIIFTPTELNENDISVLRAYINFLEAKIKKLDAGGSGRLESPSASEVV